MKQYAVRLEKDKTSCACDLETIVDLFFEAEAGDRFCVAVVEIDEDELEALNGD